jgi:hypothetical protein
VVLSRRPPNVADKVLGRHRGWSRISVSSFAPWGLR